MLSNLEVMEFWNLNPGLLCTSDIFWVPNTVGSQSILRPLALERNF